MKKTIQAKQSGGMLAQLANGAKLLHYGSLVFDWLRQNRHDVMSWLESWLS